MIRSESRAIATSAVAASARTTDGTGGLSAARRARKEDHAVGVPRYLLERAHHHGIAVSLRAGERHRGPQPGIQLALELLDHALLVLCARDVPFGDQHLSVAWLHA